MEERDLQEKVAVYRVLEARLEAAIKQRDSIASRIVEMQAVKESIGELEKSDDVIFPVGSDVFAFGKIAEKKKVMVAVGAGVVMEKSIAEAKEILDKRREEMEQVMKEVQGNIEKVSSTLEQLGSEIQSTMEQA
jgi:prefoldin alpha subunit